MSNRVKSRVKHIVEDANVNEIKKIEKVDIDPVGEKENFFTRLFRKKKIEFERQVEKEDEKIRKF